MNAFLSLIRVLLETQDQKTRRDIEAALPRRPMAPPAATRRQAWVPVR